MTPTPTPPPQQSGHTALRALAMAAALLFAAGLGLGMYHAPAEFAAGLRWTALGLFVPFAARRRSLLV